jgi:stearoyl-CoA desaturase (delta-9 desaturase)
MSASPLELAPTAPARAPSVPNSSPLRAVLLWLFLLGPLAGLALAVALAATVGLGPSWLDVGLGVGLFFLTGHGVSVGLHRYFTHGAFRANRQLKIALAVTGSLALEGDVTGWVATHRLHHARADQDGDPHSPWRYGTGPTALAKGLVWAQVGWMTQDQHISKERWAPDLVADPDLQRIDHLYPLWIAVTVLAPALVGGLATMSWTGAVTGLLWAGLARIFLLHHVTWMVNSVCHVFGSRPFRARDRATNVWPLAVVSMGESWHNLHHADPTCARHGVDPGQLDSSAAVIALLERIGWATHVHWPDPVRLARRRSDSRG